MKTILAKRDDGKGLSEVLFDERDTKIVGDWSWRVSANGYVYRNAWALKRNHKLYLHRAILLCLGASRRIEVDHINGNKLDNRRENIRLCTRGHNNAARGRHRKGLSSKYRGVTWAKDKKRWQAQIGIGGKNKMLGRFKTEEEAARAYDAAARQFYGDFARPNFED